MTYENDTAYRVPVDVTVIGDSTYLDMSAKDVEDTFKETPHGDRLFTELKNMAAEKESLRKQNKLLVSYSFTAIAVLLIVIFINKYWNRFTDKHNEKMDNKLKQYELTFRLLLYAILFVGCLSLDVLLMFNYNVSNPIFAFPLLGFAVANMFQRIFVISRLKGYDDSRMEKKLDTLIDKIVEKYVDKDNEPFNDDGYEK